MRRIASTVNDAAVVASSTPTSRLFGSLTENFPPLLLSGCFLTRTEPLAVEACGTAPSSRERK